MSSGNIAEVLGEFDPNSPDIAPATGFDAIPPGWYPLQIDDAEVVDTKAGTGKILKLELTIIGNEFNGRKLWARLNIANPNQQCVDIAMRELAAIGQALGLAAITDTADLIGGQLQGKVKVKQDPGREPDNEVHGYKALGEAAAPTAQAPEPETRPPAATRTAPAVKPTVQRTAAAKPAATTAAGKAATTGKRPWER